MTGALLAEGKGGVIVDAQYDLWSPSRQYMVYHGQPRILTEIASARLADPYVNPAEKTDRSAPSKRARTSPGRTTKESGVCGTSSTTG